MARGMTQAPGNLACHISQLSGSDLFGFLSSDASLALTHFLFSCYQFQWCARSICFGSISLSRNSLKFLPWISCKTFQQSDRHTICDYAHPVLPSSNRFQSSSLFVLRIFFLCSSAIFSEYSMAFIITKVYSFISDASLVSFTHYAELLQLFVVA